MSHACRVDGLRIEHAQRAVAPLHDVPETESYADVALAIRAGVRLRRLAPAAIQQDACRPARAHIGPDFRVSLAMAMNGVAGMSAATPSSLGRVVTV